jgi:hypothetical protein
MPLAAIDLALRAATVAMLLVLAAALLRDFGRVITGRLAVAFAIGSAAHASTSAIGVVPPVSALHALLIALATGNVVVFWLFCRALFDDAFALRWWHGLIWLAVAAFSFINCMWIGPDGHGRLAINLIALGFIILALAQTVASGSADLVQGRRYLRMFVVVASALYGGLNAVLQILALGSDAAGIVNLANVALLACIVAVVICAMMQVTANDLFSAPVPAPAKVEADVVDAADQKLIDALMRLMADERIYRHDNVTIGTLATRLAIPEYRLRR